MKKLISFLLLLPLLASAQTGPLLGKNGGTGIANTGKTITLNSSLTWPADAAGFLKNNGSGSLSYDNTLLSNALSNGKIFVGNGSNIATGVTPTLNSSAGSFTVSNAGQFTFPDASGSGRGFLNSTDWNTFNNKQAALSGTGYVYQSGSTTSYTPTIPISSLSNITYTLNGAAGTLGSAATGTFTAGATGSGFSLNFSSSTQVGNISLSHGGTNADLSATGGTSQVLKQTSIGGNITVGQLAASDLSNGTTGTNSVVLSTSPQLTTPNIGAATGTSLAMGASLLLGTKITLDGGSSQPLALYSNATNKIAFYSSGAGTFQGLLGASSSQCLVIFNNIGGGTTCASFNQSGFLYLGGTSAPSAVLHLRAGTSTASTAPIKFTSGTNTSTAEPGTFEYDGTAFYATPSGTSRYKIGVVLTGSATLDFPNTSALANSDLTISVTGAADGDPVSLGVPNGSEPGSTNDYNWRAWVSSSNTVTVRFMNLNTVTAIDPASGTFKVTVNKN